VPGGFAPDPDEARPLDRAGGDPDRGVRVHRWGPAPAGWWAVSVRPI